MKKVTGFTLIELTIVVAIIGILAAIALLQYQSFVVKSQLTSAVAELNGARPQYELIMNDGSASNSTAFTVANMFFSTSSQFCTYAVSAPVEGVANPALECKLTQVASVIKGKSVFFNRDKSGVWSCSTSVGIPNKFKPVDCI
ncbi:pilin [Acinetobacter sp. I-MWF]|uniref:pilin n=1 Tax=Acinetobacter sp. I-MWF TaxID=2940517 RepID=UPI0021C8E7C3|nr:pilin [Acinetobacter sp. I-MWF]MCT9977020.1 pilin [Acinetobacter sp. I-MWF]